MANIRRFTMQDRSGGKVNRTDENLSLQDALHMTDYSDEEVDKIADLQVGQELLFGREQDISIKRTE